MRAVQILRQGIKNSEVKVNSIAKPAISSKEILVRNTFAGINFIDTYHRSGLYYRETPFVLGVEGTGVVEEIGDSVYEENNFDFKIGDRVAYYSNGAFAEFTAVNPSLAYALPRTVSDRVGATCSVQALTAHYLAHSIGKLDSKSSCLVHACAGGTGRILCQIAKALGARVIGTCSTSKISEALTLADEVIDYKEQPDVAKIVQQLTYGLGVDVVFDGVGLKTYQSSLESVKRRGLVCFFGNASGPVPPIDPLDLSKYGSIYITRPTLADFIADRNEFHKRCSDIFEYIIEGKVSMRIEHVYSLEDVGIALEYIEKGFTSGKLLLKI